MSQTPSNQGPTGKTLPVPIGPAPKPQIAICLSGGGAKGDFEVGAVQYLYEKGIRPDILCGTSVGAINALKLAEGEPQGPQLASPHVQGLAGLVKIWKSLQREGDMWSFDPTVSDLAQFITEKVPELMDKLLGDVRNGIMGGIGFVANAVFFPGPPIVGFTNLIFGATPVIDDISDDVKLLMHKYWPELMALESVANLNPIFATMHTPASFSPAMQQNSGIKLRLAMVALEDGHLRYMTETGAFLERDGSPVPQFVPDPKCADPIRTKIEQKKQEIADYHKIHGQAPKDPQQKGPDPDLLLLQKQLAQLQAQLQACPKILGAPKGNVLWGALASSSIPVFFPPVELNGMRYVDGGVRELVPIEGAIRTAGATMVYAIAAASRDMKDIEAPAESFRIAQTGLRVSKDIMPNEIGLRDLYPPNDWPVPVVVIQPEAMDEGDPDVHDGMRIEPGLISIRVDHGYMRADDTLQAWTEDPKKYRAVLEKNKYLQRNTAKITLLRRQIWDAEFPANGKTISGPTDFISQIAKGVPTIAETNPSLPALQDVRDRKRKLKQMVDERLKAGGACPVGYQSWWMDWERHNWPPRWPLWTAADPFVPLKKMTVSITPATIHYGVSTGVTVAAADNNGVLPGAQVFVNEKLIGPANQLITHVFQKQEEKTFDPKTKTFDIDIIEPELTVKAKDYETEKLNVKFI